LLAIEGLDMRIQITSTEADCRQLTALNTWHKPLSPSAKTDLSS